MWLPPNRNSDVWTIDLGMSRVRVVSPDALSILAPGAKPPTVPSLVNFTVAVTDLDATRGLLADRDVPFDTVCDTTGNALVVPAAHGAGTAVSFTAT